MTRIKSILPPNASVLQKDVEAVITERLLSLNIDVISWMNNADICPEEILPWLAWAVSVDVWDNNWSIETKRSVIKESIQVHKLKGTIGALRRALASFGFADIRIEEWFDYGGEPFTFRVYAIFQEDGLSIEEANLIHASIMQTKNLRSHLDQFRPEIETISNRPTYGIAFGHLETTTIYPRK